MARSAIYHVLARRKDRAGRSPTADTLALDEMQERREAAAHAEVCMGTACAACEKRGVTR
jgi:hypothetical protein